MIGHKCAEVRYSAMNYIDKQRIKLTRNTLLDYILEGDRLSHLCQHLTDPDSTYLEST